MDLKKIPSATEKIAYGNKKLTINGFTKILCSQNVHESKGNN